MQLKTRWRLLWITLAALLVAGYIRLVFWLNRWHISGLDSLPLGPCIFAFWHGRLLMIPPAWPKPAQMHVLVSTHRDGIITQKILHLLGFNIIAGTSSNDSGTRALRHIISTLKKGDYVAITPDGPRGPRHRVKGSIVAIARKLNVPIIPVCYKTTRGRALRSWDHFWLPGLFGRGLVLYGQPLYVEGPSTEDNDAHYTHVLEERLNRQMMECDHRVQVQ